MTVRNTLLIDLHSYWHAGTGRSAGALADALVQKNSQGLPVIGGRQIKGLLRHAVVKAEAMGWFAAMSLPQGPATSIETLLFGSANQEEGRFATLPGMLVVGNASLPEEEAAWLASPEQAAVRQHLFTQLSSTAINEYGTAVENSLRTIEVSLPMQLVVELQLILTAVDAEHRKQQQLWLEQSHCWQALQQASSLIDSVGASRSRGFGEAQFIWQGKAGGSQ